MDTYFEVAREYIDKDFNVVDVDGINEFDSYEEAYNCACEENLVGEDQIVIYETNKITDDVVDSWIIK